MTSSHLPNNPKKQSPAPEQENSGLLGGLLGVITVIFLGPVLLIGLYFLVSIIVGTEVFVLDGQTTPFQNAQTTLWFTILGAIITIAIVRSTRKSKHEYFKTIGTMFMIFAPLILLGTSIGFVNSYRSHVSAANGPNTCNMTTQLNKAIHSTYPIATDSGSGTAFAIDGEGTLLTAYHVIEGAKSVYVSYKTGHEPLTIIKTSPAHDLALLKYGKPTPQHLKIVDANTIGEPVYALGYPGNAFTAGQATVSQGIVSRILDNDDVKLTAADAPSDLSFIQTYAAINSGNSGGALVNKCGVVGVVSAVSDSAELHKYNLPVSEQNISFAIDSKSVKSALGL